VNDDQVMQVLRRKIVEIVPDVDPAQIRPGASLADLGCNSLDRMDIVTLTMADLGVTGSVEQFRPGQDLAGLAAQLAART